MIKPVFVVRFPVKFKYQDIEKLIYGGSLKDIKEQYNVVFLMDEFSEEIEFECHNADFNETVKTEDLQERLIILMESALHRIRQNSITEEIKKQEEDEKNRKERASRPKNGNDIFVPHIIHRNPWYSTGNPTTTVSAGAIHNSIDKYFQHNENYKQWDAEQEQLPLDVKKSETGLIEER